MSLPKHPAAALVEYGTEGRCHAVPPLLALRVHTGLRRGEALALQWSDVDLTHGLLRVRGTLSHIHGALVVSGPKSARSKRVVPLSRPTCRLLHDVRDARDALAARRT